MRIHFYYNKCVVLMLIYFLLVALWLVDDRLGLLAVDSIKFAVCRLYGSSAFHFLGNTFTFYSVLNIF